MEPENQQSGKGDSLWKPIIFRFHVNLWRCKMLPPPISFDFTGLQVATPGCIQRGRIKIYKGIPRDP